MIVRNEKYTEDGVIYYRMQRGDYKIMVAVTPTELEVGRQVVAKRIKLARARFDHLRRWGMLR